MLIWQLYDAQEWKKHLKTKKSEIYWNFDLGTRVSLNLERIETAILEFVFCNLGCREVKLR